MSRFAAGALLLNIWALAFLTAVAVCEDAAYAAARRNYGSQGAVLTAVGAATLVGEFVSQTNFTCRRTSACDQCFDLVVLLNSTTATLTSSEFRTMAAQMLLATYSEAVFGVPPNASDRSSCPRSTGDASATRLNASDLLDALRQGGGTAGEQLQSFLSQVEKIYTGASSCFNSVGILSQLSVSEETTAFSDELAMQALVNVFFYMAQGYAITPTCAMAPTEMQLNDDLFELLGMSNSSSIPLQEFTDALKTFPRSDGTSAGLGIDSSASPARTCLSTEQLLSAYGFAVSGNESLITQEQVLIMSPALLQQKLGDYCSAEATDTAEEDAPSTAEVYGYGTLAVLVISLLPVLGIMLLPCMTTKAADLILTFFTALAIGTMLADALMHIIPEMLSDATEIEGEISHTLWKMVTTCLGIYAFFLFEMGLHMVRKNIAGHKETTNECEPHGHSHQAGVLGHSHLNAADFMQSVSMKSLHTEDTDNGHGETTSNNATRKKACGKISCFDIKPFAAVVLVGDALHNCADGLAVGIGFATSVRLGLSMAIAVCCHEVPHEIGNYAVLLSAGINKWKVLGLSLFSTSSAFVGLFIGASVGTETEASSYILAITAATFFYVALVDLLPSLMHKATNTPCLHFLVINIGVLLGFLIMLLFAIYEEQIAIE